MRFPQLQKSYNGKSRAPHKVQMTADFMKIRRHFTVILSLLRYYSTDIIKVILPIRFDLRHRFRVPKASQAYRRLIPFPAALPTKAEIFRSQ